jgi:choline dehydrogenase-like flavoprotein
VVAVDAALRNAAGKPPTCPCASSARAGRDGLASSVNLLLPDAEKTGKLTSIANAVVREITVDKNTGLPNGCTLSTACHAREMSVKARVVVLAAGTLESTRLLLNSKLANSSGVMGRYLMDQIYGAGMVCSVPEARGGKGTRRSWAAAPSFRASATSTKSQDKFLRGYAFNRHQQHRRPVSAELCGLWRGAAAKLDEYYGSAFS